MTLINSANLLSISRILLVPFIVYFFLNKIEGLEFLAGIIFVIASLTDWLDGYMARKFNKSSEIGSVLDLAADKILVLVTLFFVSLEYSDNLISTITCLVLIREVIILSLRSTYGQKKTEVIFIGKLKTFFQMLGIACLLIFDPKTMSDLFFLAEGVLILSVIIGYLSLWAYLQKLK
jgi:CDP-diacylglycerol--glycerol-3-phosphate 3-phosphatidyltransferase